MDFERGGIAVTREADARVGVGAGLPSSGRRPELQALRALAVVAVVINHSWPGLAPGGYFGVDIFFVVSGFLITRQLVRERDLRGRISLPRFYLRRARRLLPAATLVLLAVAAMTFFFVPEREWRVWFGEIAASALYVQNWAVVAAGPEATAVTHFWSLSVEEQFYLFWPVIVIGGAALAGVLRRSARMVLIAVVVLIAAASLVHWIVVTAGDYDLGYFSTLSRAWEFAAGALVALVPAELRRGSRWAPVLFWAGLAAVVAAVLVVGPNLPHTLALLPVLGTVAIIVSSNHHPPASARWLVELRPVQFTGDISYALYLWHWPVLLFAPLITGVPSESWFMVLLLAFAVALSWATTRFVENPARRTPLQGAGFRARRVLVAGGVTFGLLAILGLADAGTRVSSQHTVACVERVVVGTD
ncbi:hypothetical protein BH10ACT7_BH10ACT7_09750 [soil metagenome]